MEGFLLVLMIAGGVALLCVLAALFRTLRSAGNLVSRIAALLHKDGVTFEEGPRSVSALDSLLLPQVQRDFPEYNPELVLARVKRDAKTYYESAAAGRVLYEDGISSALRAELPGQFPNGVAGGVTVHKAALSAYDAKARDRMLTFQAAVEYRDASGGARQRRLTLKYLAAYDENVEQEVRRFNCPNCGAPVPALGDKRCEYCGSALKVSAGLGWVLVALMDG